MRVDIHADPATSPELARALRRRVYAELARVSPWLRTVEVVLDGTRCLLRLRGRSLPMILVEQLAPAIETAVVAAAARAQRTVAGELARRHPVSLAAG